MQTIQATIRTLSRKNVYTPKLLASWNIPGSQKPIRTEQSQASYRDEFQTFKSEIKHLYTPYQPA